MEIDDGATKRTPPFVLSLKYFEGYARSDVRRRWGKGSNNRLVYIDDYYRQEVSDTTWVALKILYAFLCLLAIVLYVAAASLPLPSNTAAAWYVTIPQALSLLCLAWVLLSVLGYVTAARNLTVYGFRKSGKTIRSSSVTAAICLGTTAVMNLLFVAVNPDISPFREMTCTSGYACGCLLMLGIFFSGRRVRYNKVPNPHTDIQQEN